MKASSTHVGVIGGTRSPIDLLEHALDARQASGDLSGWVTTFLEADWIQNKHLTHPDDGADAEAIRSLLRNAKSWEDLVVPASRSPPVDLQRNLTHFAA
nr:hypothetical protein [uncultured Duganella sp.]